MSQQFLWVLFLPLIDCVLLSFVKFFILPNTTVHGDSLHKNTGVGIASTLDTGSANFGAGTPSITGSTELRSKLDTCQGLLCLPSIS